LTQDLADLQPYLRLPTGSDGIRLSPVLPTDIGPSKSLPAASLDIEDGEDLDIQNDIAMIRQLCNNLICDQQSRKEAESLGLSQKASFAHGVDLVIETQQGIEFPAHSVVLAARCPIIEGVLAGLGTVRDQESSLCLRLVHKQRPTTPSVSRLAVTGCHALSLLILFTYLYTDKLPAIWDRRIAVALDRELHSFKIKPEQINLELQALVRVLNLASLAQIVSSPSKRVLSPSMAFDMARLLDRTGPLTHDIRSSMAPLAPDVILQLADTDLFCHSIILRARSAFFADFFDDPDWTANRWDVDGTIKVNMKHMKELVIRLVLRFLYGEETILGQLGQYLSPDGCIMLTMTTVAFANSVNDVLEFAFEVMAAAVSLFDSFLLISLFISHV
jgi:inhibitor of Bruton tyrosine kinase